MCTAAMCNLENQNNIKSMKIEIINIKNQNPQKEFND
jgi:hypothetical protein